LEHYDNRMALARIDPLETLVRVESVDLATDVQDFLLIAGLVWSRHRAYWVSQRPDLQALVRVRYASRRENVALAVRRVESHLAGALCEQYGQPGLRTLGDLKTRLEERGGFRQFKAGSVATLNRVLAEYGIAPFAMRSYDQGAYLRRYGVRPSRR
jgi:hypothetical protein